ncbi:MAG: RluA family pseudouridine synthase [Phycisphaeraceae bacterium]|nr:RluA family pseudouridine synthase [Phycisphaeraceae bacterium]
MSDSEQPPSPPGDPESSSPDLAADGPGTEELLELYTRQDADDETPVTVSFEISRAIDKRIDRYLVDRVPFLSRTSLQRLIRESSVTVNGRVPKPSTKLRRGDLVVAVLPPPPSREIGADEIPLEVLFEDEHLIVVNKQANLIVHPARSIKRGTLVNALAWHFLHSGSGHLSSVGEDLARPGIVHRLDRHTTGAIVAAKSDVAHWRLAKQFQDRRTSKRYLALVHGSVEPDGSLVDLPLGKHPTIRERYAVRWDDTGKASQTVVRVLERYPAAEPSQTCSLVELDLLTGRTHQIRVHLSHLGWPIVGDDLYEGRPLRRSASGDALIGEWSDPRDPGRDRDGSLDGREGEPAILARQALHATSLEFSHPISGEPLRFVAPLPADLRAAIDLLRRRRCVVVDAPGHEIDLAEVGVPRAA